MQSFSLFGIRIWFVVNKIHRGSDDEEVAFQYARHFEITPGTYSRTNDIPLHQVGQDTFGLQLQQILKVQDSMLMSICFPCQALTFRHTSVVVAIVNMLPNCKTCPPASVGTDCLRLKGFSCRRRRRGRRSFQGQNMTGRTHCSAKAQRPTWRSRVVAIRPEVYRQSKSQPGQLHQKGVL